PHRSFATVSYIFNGYVEHKDSRGHAGKLGPLDVQWRTAGAGVIHSEMPAQEFAHLGDSITDFNLG
ncbi:MAG TPA: pirin family protein, partial [Candidatus Caenarcaniphilales bacterium]